MEEAGYIVKRAKITIFFTFFLPFFFFPFFVLLSSGISIALLRASSVMSGLESTAGSSSHLDLLPISLSDYERYGRQMILPRFGLAGQIKLRKAKVLVVGAGGLGCPAIQYLTAAGVGELHLQSPFRLISFYILTILTCSGLRIGHITIVDNDHVESSNLARQILHNDERIGMNKAQSAAKAAQK